MTIATYLASALIFFLGRYVFKERVVAFIAKHKQLATLDSTISEQPFKLMFLLRLTPLPFALLSYAFSVTQARFWPYLGATSGILIYNASLVYMGYTTKHLAGLVSGSAKQSGVSYPLLALGVVISVLVLFYVTKIARETINRLTSERSDAIVLTEFYNGIPPLLVQFVTTVAFSFVVGLEFRSYHHTNNYTLHFGSTRTFVLIGILGFILYTMDASRLLFAAGLLLLGALLLVFYWRLSSERLFSLFSTLFALLIYLIGPIASAFPSWFLVLFIVVLIVILGEKPLIHRISDQLANEEIVTLAKFLIISGVILPLLPDQPIAPMLPVTYYRVWLAVIIVSGFSYLSYLVNTYFFKSRSLLITGLLGGLYSSTAATIVIGRRAHGLESVSGRNVSSALIMATTMMYIRLLAIIFVFDWSVGLQLLTPFIIIIVHILTNHHWLANR